MTRKSNLLKQTWIDDAQDIGLRSHNGGVIAEVGFYEKGKYKQIFFTLRDANLMCIAQQIRNVLRGKRTSLATIITAVEEKV